MSDKSLQDMVNALSEPPQRLSKDAERRVLHEILKATSEDAQPPVENEIDRWFHIGSRRLQAALFGGLAAMAAVIILLLSLRPWQPEPTKVQHAVTQRILSRQGVAAIGDIDLSRPLMLPERSALTAAIAPGLIVRYREKTRASPLSRAGDRYVLALHSGAIDVRYDRAPGAPPLTIETSNGQIEVLGTTFHVAVDSEFSVAVTRGRVEVVRGADRKRIHKGEQLGKRFKRETIEAWAAQLDAPSAKVPHGFLVLRGDLGVLGQVSVGGQAVTALPAWLQHSAGPIAVKMRAKDGRTQTLHVTIEPEKTVRLHLEFKPEAVERPKAPKPQKPPPRPRPKKAPQKVPQKLQRNQLDEIYSKAEAHLAKGEIQPAIKNLDRITRLDPQGGAGALAFFELGRLHREAGRLKRAETAFGNAIAANVAEPLRSRARLGLCGIAIRRQESQKAKACLSLLLRSSRGSTAAKAALLEGQVFCMEGRFDAAERRFFRAMELSPGGLDAEVRLGRVRCAIQQGALHRAKTLLAGVKGNAHRAERRELESIIEKEKKRKK